MRDSTKRTRGNADPCSCRCLRCGDPRSRQFWQARSVGYWPPGTESLSPASADVDGLPGSLSTPDRLTVLREEQELFGFTVSGHPLDLHAGIARDTYCPISRIAQFPGNRVIVCGLIIEESLHRQSNGDTMKFITHCDYTGFIECEIFAEAYRSWGLATVRLPIEPADQQRQSQLSGMGLVASGSGFLRERARGRDTKIGRFSGQS